VQRPPAEIVAGRRQVGFERAESDALVEAFLDWAAWTDAIAVRGRGVAAAAETWTRAIVLIACARRTNRVDDCLAAIDEAFTCCSPRRKENDAAPRQADRAQARVCSCSGGGASAGAVAVQRSTSPRFALDRRVTQRPDLLLDSPTACWAPVR
jgi:hypothetical protein